MSAPRTPAERVQAEAQKRAALRATQLDKDFTDVLALPAGRRVLMHLLEAPGLCASFASSFTGNSETFFREGRRAVGIALLQWAQRVAPEAYVNALTEELTARREEALLVKRDQEKHGHG
jgi:hypothetical protein